MDRDYSDMLHALFVENVDYLVVGAYAMASHGLVRATGDIDIWVRPTIDNAQRLWRALTRFRAPLSKMKLEDFVDADMVYQIGVAPHRIDVLTSITGVSFDDAWPRRKATEIDGVRVNVVGRDDLIANKRAAGRPKDLADVAWLESEQSDEDDQ